MDFKSIAALAVLAGIGGWFAYHLDIRSNKSTLAQARSMAATDLKGIEEKRGAVQAAREKVEVLQALYDNSVALKGKLTALEAERESLQHELVDAVNSLRARSVGMAWQDIALPNGKTLQGVRIQKVTDSEVTFVHSLGVLKVPAADVPDDLRKKFRLGSPMLSTAGTSTSVKKKDPAPAAGSAASPLPLAFGPTTEQIATVGRLKVDIDDLEGKIKTLRDNKDAWLARSAALRLQASSAQSSGQPSYAFTTQANQAEQTAAGIDAQVSTLQTTLVAVRKKLADAMAAAR